MTVDELIDKLSKLPPTMPVFAEWEGVSAYIDPDNFRVELHRTAKHESMNCLLINVDAY